MLELNDRLEANPAELLFAPYALFKSGQRAYRTYKYYKTGKQVLTHPGKQVVIKKKDTLGDIKTILILVLLILLIPTIKEMFKK